MVTTGPTGKLCLEAKNHRCGTKTHFLCYVEAPIDKMLSADLFYILF
jgi:hypothetical protein